MSAKSDSLFNSLVSPITAAVSRILKLVGDMAGGVYSLAQTVSKDPGTGKSSVNVAGLSFSGSISNPAAITTGSIAPSSGTLALAMEGSSAIALAAAPGGALVVTASQASPLWVTASGLGGGGGSVTQGGAWTTLVSASVANPVWVQVTGAVPVSTGVFPTVTVLTGAFPTISITSSVSSPAYVQVTGAVPVTASLTNPVTVAVSGNLLTIFSGTAYVTSAQGSPVWVTGTQGQVGPFAASVSGTIATGSQVAGTAPVIVAGVDTGNAVRTLQTTNAGVQIITSSVGAPVYVQVTGAVPVATHAVTQGGALATQVSGTVTATFTGNLPIGILTVTASSAAPAYVAFTGSAPITGTVTISNPTGIPTSSANPATGTLSLVMAGTSSIALAGTPAGVLRVEMGAPGTTDVFGQLVTSVRVPQVQAQFFSQAPSTQIIISTSGGATATGPVSGVAVFRTTTATTARVSGSSPAGVVYTAHYELYAAWTWQYTQPTSVATYQRVGLYNLQDGFSVGYSGTTFGFWTRFSGTDTFFSSASWNGSKLDGSAKSAFTSGTQPVVFDPTTLNIYRVRYGWLGAATVFLEIAAPDGDWVTAHTIRYANLFVSRASITSPNLPFTFDINKSAADATDLVGCCGCFVGGMTSFPDSSVLDWNNTSYTVLGSNAGFTGSATDVMGYTQIVLSAFSDQNSAVGGVIAQFSMDGQNWDEQVSGSYVAGGNADTMMIPARGRFYRAIYMNAASAQATFRLQTILRTLPGFGDIIEMNDTPTISNHAQLVRAQLIGKQTAGPNSGTFTDVRVNAAGNLATSNTAVVTPGGTPADADAIGFQQGGAIVMASGTSGSLNVHLDSQVVQVTGFQASPVWVTGTITTVGGGAAVTQGGAWATQVSGVVTSTLTGTVGVTQGGAFGTAVSGVLGATAVTITATVAAPAYVAVTGALPVATHAVTQGGAFGVLVSGTAGVVQSGALAVQVSGVLASGSQAANPNPVLVAGADSTNTVRSLQLTNAGVAIVTATVTNPVPAVGPVLTGTNVSATPGGGYPVLVGAPDAGGVMRQLRSIPKDTTVPGASDYGLLAYAAVASGGNPSYTDTKANLLVMDLAGNLRVNTGTMPVVTVTSTVTNPAYIQVTGALPINNVAGTSVTIDTNSGTIGVSGTWGGAVLVTASVSNPVYVRVTGALPVATHAVTQGGAFGVLVSGTIGATQSGALSVQISGVLASGSQAANPNPVLVGGADSTNTVRTFQTTNAGVQVITASSGAPAYVAVTGALPVATHAVTQGGALATAVSGVLGATAVTVTATVAAPVYVAFTGAVPINNGGGVSVSVDSNSGTLGVSGTWGGAVLTTSSVSNPVYIRVTGNLPASVVQGGAFVVRVSGVLASGSQAANPPPVLIGGSTSNDIVETVLVDALGATIVTASTASPLFNADVTSPSGSGALTYQVVSVNSNNAAAIKASAGQVYGWYINNVSLGWRYVKIYNKASSPAPATDTGLLELSLGVPGGGAANIWLSAGIKFSTGIAIAIVSGSANADNTSVGASELVVNIFYQ